MKYIKSVLYLLVIYITLNFIITIFDYFDIFNKTIINYLEILSIIISFFYSCFYLGKNCKQKAYIESIKISLSMIFISIISCLIFKIKIINLIIYYLIIIISSYLGSIFGINKKKSNN